MAYLVNVSVAQRGTGNIGECEQRGHSADTNTVGIAMIGADCGPPQANRSMSVLDGLSIGRRTTFLQIIEDGTNRVTGLRYPTLPQAAVRALGLPH